MRKTLQLQKTLFAVIAAIACLSFPASAETIIALNIGSSTTGSSTWTDVGSPTTDIKGTLLIEQVHITDTDNGALDSTINLSANADDFSLAFDVNASSLTITAGTAVQAPFANLTPSNAIETGTTGLGYTCSSCTSSTLSLSLNSSVSVTGVLANFLTDLGLPTTPSTLVIAGSITGSNGTISSDTITLIDTADVTVTPEPSSMFLLGAGLAFAAAMARKRQLGAAKS